MTEFQQKSRFVLPQASSRLWSRLKYHIKESILISEKHPRSLQFFGNLKTIREIRMRHIASGSTIIHKFSMFRLYYEIYMGLVYFACFLVLPIQYTFASKSFNEAHVIGLFLNSACYLDIALRFRTSYVDYKNTIVDMNPSKIAKKYLKSVHFVADVLSSLPDPLYFYHEENIVVLIFCLLTALKFLRAQSAYYYLARAAQYFHLDGASFRVIIVTTYFLLMFHWTCCLIFLIPHFRKHITGQFYENSWLATLPPDENSYWQLYSRVFFRAACYLFCIQYSTTNELAIEEKLFTCVCNLGGTVVLFYVTVRLIYFFLGLWSLELRYYEAINGVEGFMKRKNIAPAVRNRVHTYYNYKFQNTYFEEGKITNYLSEPLKNEIDVYVLKRLIHNVEIFKDLPYDAVKKIVSHLRPEVFLPHDVIIKAGGSGDSMYFISSGTVAIHTPSGKEVCHLRDGEYFGEIVLILKDEKRTAHVIAIEICELYKLSRRGFNACIKGEKDLMKKLHNEAVLRKQMTQLFEDIHTREMRG